MLDTPKDDEAKFNETLKRLLKTPPKPHKSDKEPGDCKESLTEADQKKNPGGPPDKKDHPEAQ